LPRRMPVDYSKFKDIEDSDEEPVWETKGGKNYKGFPQKVLEELDKSSEALKSRRCFCFLDLASDPRRLREYAADFEQNGAPIPRKRQLGRVIIELDQAKHAPRLCENLRRLFTGEQGTGVGNNKLHYKGRKLDLILPKYCLQVAIQNEYSCWGKYLDDEKLRIPGVSFDKPGLVAVGNHGPNTNSCTCMILLNEAGHLNGYNQIVGRVVRGMEVLRVVEMFPTDRKEQSFVEKNVKTWWGGHPMVDVVVEDCGELPEGSVDLSAPEDGDVFPEHPIDHSHDYDPEKLMEAQERLREIGNAHYKKKSYQVAVEKYAKARKYLEPMLRTQHVGAFGDEDVTTWLAGGVRPKDRTPPVRADLTLRLNICQAMLAMNAWHEAAALAEAVLLELVGKHSKKGHGALPNDPLVVKALFRRSRAYAGISEVPGEVSRWEEAIEDLRQALLVDPDSEELKAELERLQARQREADSRVQGVYQNMLKPE